MHIYSVLVVDDESSIRLLLEKELATPHRTVTSAATGHEAIARCLQESFDVILLDIRLSDADGVTLISRFLEQLPDAKIIMITGYADIDIAVTAMRNGAYDFVSKPFLLDKLEVLIDRAYEHTCLTQENRCLRLSSSTPHRNFVGQTSAIRHVRYLLNKVAPTTVPVLITGESGAGKDVVAVEIHQRSKRASRPFVVKNCAGLQKDLARSELFGHVKGAFTNAFEAAEGLMTVAERGTLFLDEVGELPLEVQSQLLRVLESNRYRRVGDKEERNADIRFIFATNRHLAQEVQAGNFLEALYHRINVFQITLPPLRERPDDIIPLVDHYLSVFSSESHPYTITKEALTHLLSYSWPGNVRELRNVLERGTILAENYSISTRALPQEMVGAPRSAYPVPIVPPTLETVQAADDSHSAQQLPLPEQKNKMPAARTLEDMEREHIIHALSQCNDNKQKTAKMLGIARRTLYRKLERLGLA